MVHSIDLTKIKVKNDRPFLTVDVPHAAVILQENVLQGLIGSSCFSLCSDSVQFPNTNHNAASNDRINAKVPQGFLYLFSVGA